MSKAKTNTAPKAAPKADQVDTKAPVVDTVVDTKAPVVDTVVDTQVPATGDVPAGDAPAGDAPAGDAPAGDAPAGDAPAGDAPAGDAPAAEPKAPKKREVAEEIFYRELPTLDLLNPTPWRTAVIRMIMAAYPGMSLNNASTLYTYVKKAAVKANKVPDFGRSPAKAVLEQLRADQAAAAQAAAGAPAGEGAPVVDGAAPDAPATDAPAGDANKEPDAPATDAPATDAPAGDALATEQA